MLRLVEISSAVPMGRRYFRSKCRLTGYEFGGIRSLIAIVGRHSVAARIVRDAKRLGRPRSAAPTIPPVRLCGFVEDYAESDTCAGVQPADAVTQVHAVPTLLTLHGPMTNRKHDRVALQQRHDDRTRLHARPLFGQYKLTAREISIRFRQQYRYLQREHVRTVKILVQAVVIARTVFEQQWRGFILPGRATATDVIGVLRRIANVDTHRLVPTIRDRHEARIDRRAQLCDQVDR